MEQPTTAALQQIAHDVFGRELSLDEIEVYRGRLAVMIDAIRILQTWEPQLDNTEPAVSSRGIERRFGSRLSRRRPPPASLCL
jgi:hypothetical protein